MYICQYCQKACKNLNGLKKHERHCLKNPNRIPQPNPTNEKQDVYCSYCNKLCTSINSLKNHERFCKDNPNRELTYYEKTGICNLSNQGWSKGLTKDSDKRVKHISEKSYEGLQREKQLHPEKFTGKAKTLEGEELRKQKISQTMQANPDAGGLRVGSGRGKKGWYKGYFCDSTYELAYIIYNLDNNVEFKRCTKVYTYEYKGKTHKYHPDFELLDGTVVETKGYHTSLVDIKAASVTDCPIIVLYEKDLEYAFDWVKDHYKFDDLSDLYE